MSEKQKNEPAENATLRLKLLNIELLNGGINVPPSPSVLEGALNFNVSVDTRADSEKKFLYVVVTVHIRSQDLNHNLGSISASCIYFLEDFDQLVEIESIDKLNMPKSLRDLITSTSISTVRGLMFSTFKGTFLHHAILPIVDPATMTQQSGSPTGK